MPYAFARPCGYVSLSSMSRRQARSSVSTTSSLTAPVKASFSPTAMSSNLGHSTPGISSSSMPSEIITHCLSRVTPGLSSTFAFFRLARRLIKELFPTLGMPTTIRWSILPPMPRDSLRSIRGDSTLRTVSSNLSRPLPERQSTASAAPSFEKYESHLSFAAGSAVSHLFITMISGLPCISSLMSGLRLERGTRASMISTTASTSGRFFCIIRLVLVMWPGNHCIEGISFMVCSFCRF